MYSIQSDCRVSDPCILPLWTEALENTYYSCYGTETPVNLRGLIIGFRVRLLD